MQNKADVAFEAWINPLAFLEVDEPWATPGELPSHEEFIKFLCTPGIESNLPSMVKRYQEISQEPKRLSIAPAEQRILDKLVWPLRNAKVCYTLGNYLGTIALCGMVTEMIAVLLYEISNPSINGSPVNKKIEEHLFGTNFEKLGQEKRVDILYAFNLINDELKSKFDIVRQKRRRYLHLYSQDHARLAPDAREVFNATITVVVAIIGQDIRDGKILLNPSLVTYLYRKGSLRFLKKND